MPTRTDYDAEGRSLLSSLGFEGGVRKGGGSGVFGYNNLDAIWRNKETGGCIYVGNQSAARGAGVAENGAGARLCITCMAVWA